MLPPADHALAESLALAGVVIGRVLGGESLTRAMSELRATGALRAAVQDLSFSALRDYGCCDAVLARLTVLVSAAAVRSLWRQDDRSTKRRLSDCAGRAFIG